jgi:serine phosphatase RsbU (regulator of sigma subunit)
MSTVNGQTAGPAAGHGEPIPDVSEADPPELRRESWRGRLPPGAALTALLAGLLVTAALAVTSLLLYHHNERRLLNARVRELGLVISGAAADVQTPLASAAALADATGGSELRFREFISPYVGVKGQFRSVSLWTLGRSPRLRSVVGSAPASGAAARVAANATPGRLNIVNSLGGGMPGLSFVYRVSPQSRFAVYSENPLPANRRSKLESNSAFADLNYVVYLGRARRRSNLLLTSVPLPIHGLQATEVIPFGGGAFTLVVTPREPLGGSFFHALPWVIVVFGVLISLAAAMMTGRLAQRRRRAERLARELDRLAAENRRRYIEQRSIAHTLQQALLPASLPQLQGLRVNAQYVPAQSGGDVGGDWYDVVAVGERQALMAATTMALIRHATLAYIAQDPRPGVVLGKLSNFVGTVTRGYFATVLCALVEIDDHRLTLASAGHLPPLLLHGEAGDFLEISAEPPIGFPHEALFQEATVAVPPGATLVAFTDGLVERRGEVLDQGLARLREMAVREQLDEDLLARLAHELTPDDHRDDTALVSIQWQS